MAVWKEKMLMVAMQSSENMFARLYESPDCLSCRLLFVFSPLNEA